MRRVKRAVWWMCAWWWAAWMPVVPPRRWSEEKAEADPMRTRPPDDLVAELMADLDRMTPTWTKEEE